MCYLFGLMQCCAGLAERNPKSRGPWQCVGLQPESLPFPTERCAGVTAVPETKRVIPS